ncbi:mitochondrial 37S ribosomal protein uS9m KNAG_0K02010 [Huiozyma naganishii CBS 8797]|uniref:Small ribosomal subunit protein uS9m n=1 Tax=Huiozyma naganishii (strain ATCC MYA-139 / BCRC 22969 / CBS 8797 / KCTC 17520 / NBRC 10181 / NCYC 3082 / Yp74L-3) TaxID=1071383 RepID=J7RCH5_HUIN7|nr:hypothetical protein KNAG_0K02010 [Kazachstania naganishii CBS 8797]CCK72565.1 hypothetical protein KNAG_0K02010 [Kazachstania naganishii CBS 8797]
MLARLISRGFSTVTPAARQLQTRIVPKLTTFYSANPLHEQAVNELEQLLRKYIKLPTLRETSTAAALNRGRLPWISLDEYALRCGGRSRLKPTQYQQLVWLLNRLHGLDPQLINDEIKLHLAKYSKRSGDLQQHRARIPSLDSQGRSVAVGRRKAASAKAYVVRGTGDVLVNDRPLNDYFLQMRDRESVMYPFQVIDAVGDYNVYALTSGGGPTGQAEAVMLAIGKALIAFNPLLKSRLHKSGVLTTDYRRVERKKPGKLKARKMPTWVKR